MKKKFIVKVQLAGNPCRMLIYNKSQSILYEAPATQEVYDLVDGAPKAFAFARMKGTFIDFTGKLAPWQEW